MLLNAHLVHFKQLCSMLATSASQRAAVLEALIKHAVLVQGCWVVGSGVLYKEDAEAAKRSARDYIVGVNVRACTRVYIYSGHLSLE